MDWTGFLKVMVEDEKAAIAKYRIALRIPPCRIDVEPLGAGGAPLCSRWASAPDIIGAPAPGQGLLIEARRRRKVPGLGEDREPLVQVHPAPVHPREVPDREPPAVRAVCLARAAGGSARSGCARAAC